MRKRPLLFLAVVLYINTSGQQNTDSIKSEYTQKVDYFLQPLDKNQIPTGVLYDRIFPFASLDSLSLLPGAFTTKKLHFIQAWSELYDASYNNSNLLKPGWLQDIIKAKTSQDTVPIGALNYRFNVLDTNAIVNNQLYRTADTLLHDVPGRSGSPYITRQIFLASPLKDAVNMGQTIFQFSSGLLLQNNTKTINSLTVYDGQSQTLTLSPDGSFSVNYLTAGLKALMITANFSDNTTKTVYAYLTVKGTGSGGGIGYKLTGQGPVINPCTENKNYVANTAFSDYVTGQPKNGVGDIGYYYADCTNPHILKPIIILDGFDPGDNRNVTDIYDLLYYKDASNIQRNFGEEMRALGYDIIIVNFPNIFEGYALMTSPPYFRPIFRDGGADYIERNALMLVKLIQDINTQLAANSSTEQISIVGPSMGGLISRYALAYMEKNSIGHNCKLWVSFDAPQAGANIPIGDQYWIEYYARVAKNSGAKASLENKIGSVAARQQLLHHWSANSQLPAGAPTFRTQFVQNLQTNGIAGSNGYPMNVRKLAVLNGSGFGQIQPQGQSCGKILHMDGYTRLPIHILFGILFNNHVTSSEIFFRPDYGNSCTVFNGWFAKTIFSSFHDEIKTSQTPSTTKGYDMVPGGILNTQQILKEEGEDKDWASRTSITEVVPNHAFIPAVSALDLKSANTMDWAENLSTKNLFCPSGGRETPFDAYLMPVANEEHVLITAQNTAWLKQEIMGNPQPSTFIAGSLTPSSDPICTSGTFTFSPNGSATISNLIWSIGPVGTITPNGNQATITLPFNYTGLITVTLKYSLCTGQMGSISKTVNSGKATITGTYLTNGQDLPLHLWSGNPFTDYNTACNLQMTNTNMIVSGATSVTWTKTSSSPSNITWNQNGNNISFYFWAVNQTAVFRISANNGCGSTQLSFGFKSISCSGGGGGGCARYAVSPNPATSSLKVIVPNIPPPCRTASKPSDNSDLTITEVKIYDLSGNLKMIQKFSKSKAASLNVSKLQTGSYLIDISDGKYTERQQVLIVK